MRDKNVILIGPAPHILETKLEIPESSVVCRVGAVFPLSAKMIECTTDRCDYWYIANCFLKENPHTCLDPNIKHIRTTKLASTFIPKAARHKWSWAKWDLDKMQKQLKCLPNRGMRAIYDILAQKPKSLHITGITFYLGDPYYKGYATDEHYEETKIRGGDMGPHRQAPQIDFFIRNILTNPVVTIDPKLASLLLELNPFRTLVESKTQTLASPPSLDG